MKKVNFCKNKCCPENGIYNIYQCPHCESFQPRLSQIPDRTLIGYCSWGKKIIELRETAESLKQPVNCPYYKQSEEKG
jgi:hypothetical protein